MNIEEFRKYCISLPGATEDIKWEDNLVFSVGGKMFCLADLEPPFQAAFKVTEEDFTELTSADGIIQAPYFARMKWVKVTDESKLSRKEWEAFLRQSYELVKANLPKKLRESLGNVYGA
jgi:predicted DNA-binding protein (MmcQ/YjbR family)